MKVISLYQPFATLCVLGEKTNGARGWNTDYRGPLAIHATKNFPGWCRDLCRQEPFRTILRAHGYHRIDSLPVGAILGTVEVVGTKRTSDWLSEVEKLTGPDHQQAIIEQHFGDYSPGRYCWQLEKPVLFPLCIEARGKQGFWYWDVEKLSSFSTRPQ